MNNEIIQNEFPLPKNSYAAFDAISLRNLIIQRLNDQGIFTDQNYIGSNLASIIDIISFAFNTLIFYLNKTSTESTFTEAQLYENINRIVKLLDYKPIGYQTSTLVFQASSGSTFSADSYTIPRYSYVTVAGIPFSFNEDVSFSVLSGGVVNSLDDISNTKLLYQGVYRENPIYTASGDPNEVVTINIENAFVDHFNIDVYVFETRENRWIQYKNVPNLYAETPYSKAFEKRLNSNQLYEITFGDGVNGRQLEAGDVVAVYFLQSLGETGVVGPNSLASASKSLYSTTTFNQVLADVNTEQFNFLNSSQFSNMFFDNVVSSTVPKDVESADDIRKNAPANFKSQYRLVTRDDYETFIRTNFANFISDVRVYSNWDYVGKYLKYFNDTQISPTSFRQILLNQIQFADSCNFNNIYICAVPKVSRGSSLKYLLPAQKEIILSNTKPLKMLTTEVTFMDPVFKAVSLGVPTNGEVSVNDRLVCQLDVIRSSNSARSLRSIQNDIETAFKDFFDITTIKLGAKFDYSELVRRIFNVDGIKEIRTTRTDTRESFSGLSLFMWNPNFPDLDKKAVTSNVDMNDFDVFYFDDLSTLISRINVVEEVYSLQ